MVAAPEASPARRFLGRYAVGSASSRGHAARSAERQARIDAGDTYRITYAEGSRNPPTTVVVWACGSDLPAAGPRVDPQLVRTAHPSTLRVADVAPPAQKMRFAHAASTRSGSVVVLARRVGSGSCLRRMRVPSARWLGSTLGALVAAAGCGGDPLPGPCDGVDCSGHGICFVSGITPYCECARGYHAEGLFCLPGDPPDACRGVICSGHGTCVVTSGGTASCECSSGYVPHGLDCVPAACPPVWRRTLPGLWLYGVAADPAGTAIYVSGSLGSAAVLMQLDSCGELVRQQVFSGPADTWNTATRIVLDGETIHAFGSYEPWDPSVTPTEAGALHALFRRSPLELLEVRPHSTGADWTTAWYPAVARAPDGGWWIGGSSAHEARDALIFEPRVIRERADGSTCIGIPTTGVDAWVEDVAAFDGRIWVSGVTESDSYLRAYSPDVADTDPSCIGEPLGDWTLRPPALGWFFPASLLQDGEGVLMVGEGGNVTGGVAVRLRWSETEGWTAPTPWNPTEGYDRFNRAARGPAGELCAVGIGDYGSETALEYDGLFACYEPRTLELRFEHHWPAFGRCSGLAVDAAGGLLVGCARWMDAELVRCLPTGECPAIP